MISINYNPLILMVITTFLFSALIMPFIKKIAFTVGAVSIPDNKRRINKKVMPQLGGLAIFLGFLIGFLIFGNNDPIMIPILIASFLIVLFGMLDDIKELPAIYRLIVQTIASLIVIIYGNIYVDQIQIFGNIINFGIFTYPITIFFMLGAINAINLIDGLDGLCGGISSIYFLTIGIIALITGTMASLEVTITFIMFGATLGFLFHNFYPAKIYMGDIGSNFLGFIIAIIALLGYKTATITTLFVPIIILLIPILDTVFAILRRLINKKPITMPDKSHLHHQLLNKNLGHRNTVLVIYAVDILFAITSIFSALGNAKIGGILFIILAIIVTWFVFSTDIIIQRKKK